MVALVHLALPDLHLLNDRLLNGAKVKPLRFPLHEVGNVVEVIHQLVPNRLFHEVSLEVIRGELVSKQSIQVVGAVVASQNRGVEEANDVVYLVISAESNVDISTFNKNDLVDFLQRREQ